MSEETSRGLGSRVFGVYLVGANAFVDVENDQDVSDAIPDFFEEGIIDGLYLDKVVAVIDVSALYHYGGMIHCVRQQQRKLL